MKSVHPMFIGIGYLRKTLNESFLRIGTVFCGISKALCIYHIFFWTTELVHVQIDFDGFVKMWRVFGFFSVYRRITSSNVSSLFC